MSDLDLHVAPCEQEHDTEPWCWCGPTVNYENPVNGARVYVHRRTNDGPHIEPSAPEREAVPA